MGFLEITRKDLRLLTRDRRALVVLVGLPMAFIVIVGMSTGRLLGWRNDNQVLQLAVFDEDGTATSQRVTDRLGAIDGVRVVRSDTVAEVEQQVIARTVQAGVIIGPAFEDRVIPLTPRDIFDTSTGRMKVKLADLEIRISSRPDSRMVRSVVDQLVLFATLQAILPDSARRAEARDRVRAMLLGGGNADDPPGDKAGPPDQPTETSPIADDAEAEQTGSGSNPVYQRIVPGYTVMFAFFLVNIMARSFIAERELGTLARLRVAPISSLDLVLGKTLPFLCISLAQTAALFLFGRLLFGMSWGAQPWLLLPVIACTSLAATGLGLMVATLVRTDSQVSAYANFLVITLAGISGCFMPRDWLPVAMQNISLATPHAWALIAYDQTLTHETPVLLAIATSCGMLLMFSSLFLAIGYWRFQKQA